MPDYIRKDIKDLERERRYINKQKTNNTFKELICKEFLYQFNAMMIKKGNKIKCLISSIVLLISQGSKPRDHTHMPWHVHSHKKKQRFVHVNLWTVT